MRKFFAMQMVVLFLFVESTALFVHSFTRVYLNKTMLAGEMIPKSYEPVLRIAGTELALRTSQEKEIIRLRLSQILPQDSYVKIAQTAVESFFAVIPQKNPVAVIDLGPLKKRINEEIPNILARAPSCTPEEYKALQKEQFRLCLPEDMNASGAKEALKNHFQSFIQSEIPLRFSLEKADILIPVITFIQKRLALFIAISSAILLLFIALLTGPSLARRLKWIGLSLLELAVCLSILLVPFFLSLNETLHIPGLYVPLVKLFISLPRLFLSYAASITAIAGLVFLIVPLFLSGSLSHKFSKK